MNSSASSSLPASRQVSRISLAYDRASSRPFFLRFLLQVEDLRVFRLLLDCLSGRLFSGGWCGLRRLLVFCHDVLLVAGCVRGGSARGRLRIVELFHELLVSLLDGADAIGETNLDRLRAVVYLSLGV